MFHTHGKCDHDHQHGHNHSHDQQHGFENKHDAYEESNHLEHNETISKLSSDMSMNKQLLFRRTLILSYIVSIVLIHLFIVHETWSVFQMSMFWIFYALSFASYLVASFTSPGSVPGDWDDDNAKYPFINRVTYEIPIIRYCLKCDRLKPPRTHHCSECGNCIAKMDHHCAWIANCVGYYNHKPFLLLILYTFTGASFAAYMTLLRGFYIIYHWKETSNPYFYGTLFHFIMNMFYLIIFIGLVVFCIYIMRYQIIAFTKNSTCMEEVRMRFMSKALQRNIFFHPYDYGFLRNMKSLFGPNPLLWFLPITIKGDPFHWKITKNYEKHIIATLGSI